MRSHGGVWIGVFGGMHGRVHTHVCMSVHMDVFPCVCMGVCLQVCVVRMCACIYSYLRLHACVLYSCTFSVNMIPFAGCMSLSGSLLSITLELLQTPPN